MKAEGFCPSCKAFQPLLWDCNESFQCSVCQTEFRAKPKNDDDKYDLSKNFAVVCLKCGSSNVEVETVHDCYGDGDCGSPKTIFDCQSCQANFTHY